jgi:hypothetical protein
MKVSQLIEELQMMDADAEVHFSYNYGDHWRTTVAPRVGEVFEGVVERSDYHCMDKLVDDDEDIFDEETHNYKEGHRRVVVLA